MARAVQKALQCPNCGGQCAYSPADQALVCDSCGQPRPIPVDPDYDPLDEFHYHPDTPHTEQPVISGDQIHRCDTCGGEVVFTGPALSERCAYCDGPVVLQPGDHSFETMGLIPFRVSSETAQANALNWIRRRLAAPNNLNAVIANGRAAGLYAPFFTFDSHEFVDFAVTYGDESLDSVHGKMHIVFDDLLAPASPHVTPLIRDGILHDFNPDDLLPYDPAYLSGFAAEKHHLSVPQGLKANEADKDLLIRNRIRQHVNKERIKNISYKTHTSGIHYRRILLPVWILHYSYQGTPKKVVVCGLRGRTFGERPFSTWKLAGYAALLSAIAIAFGWSWGAAGLL